VTSPPAEALRWRSRDVQVRPVQPPTKRQRLYSRTDTSHLAETLRQKTLHGVLSFLCDGPLRTLAVQVTL
jgi:hypothetical protein